MEKDDKNINKHDKNSMFARIPKRTFFDDRLNKTDKLVLMAICSFINSNTNSWHMSRPAIAERAGYVRVQQIDPSIKNLQEYGYIKVKKGGLKGEVKQENTYRVIFDENEAKQIAPAVQQELPLYIKTEDNNVIQLKDIAKRYMKGNDKGEYKKKAPTSAVTLAGAKENDKIKASTSEPTLAEARAKSPSIH